MKKIIGGVVLASLLCFCTGAMGESRNLKEESIENLEKELKLQEIKSKIFKAKWEKYFSPLSPETAIPHIKMVTSAFWTLGLCAITGAVLFTLDRNVDKILKHLSTKKQS